MKKQAILLVTLSAFLEFKAYSQAKPTEKPTVRQPIPQLSQVLPITDVQHLIAGYLDSWDKFQVLNQPDTHSIAISPDNNFFVRGSHEVIEVFQYLNDNFELIQALKKFNEKAISPLAYSRNGEYLAAKTSSTDIDIWKLNDKKFVKFETIKDANNIAESIAFSPDGKYLATTLTSGDIKIWILKDNKFVYIQTLLNNKHITTITFIDEDRLISGSRSGTIKIWQKNKQGFICIQEEKAHENEHISITCSQNNKCLISFAPTEGIKIWKLQDGKLMLVQILLEQKISSVAITSDGSCLASKNLFGPIKIWKWIGDKFVECYSIDAPEVSPSVMKFSQDGTFLIFGNTLNLQIMRYSGFKASLDKKESAIIESKSNDDKALELQKDTCTIL